MSRCFPKSSSLVRKIAKRPPALRIVIICEGATEAHYFKALGRQNPLVEVRASDDGGAVRVLVGKVLQAQQALTQIARKSGDSFEKNFIVWGVPDVDQHPKLTEALNLAAEHKLNIALSNPCFEIWGILHFRRHDAPIHRHEAQRLLASLLPGYSHDRNPYFDVDTLEPLYETAKVNAKWLCDRRSDENNAKGNPSTDVHLLTEIIRTGLLP